MEQYAIENAVKEEEDDEEEVVFSDKNTDISVMKNEWRISSLVLTSSLKQLLLTIMMMMMMMAMLMNDSGKNIILNYTFPR